MQVATNTEYVRTRKRRQRRLFWLGMLMLSVALVVYFYSYGDAARANLLLLAWPLMIGGYVLSNMSRHAQFQVGVPVSTEERVVRGLQKLNNRYWLGNYVPVGNTLVDHILVGPEGVLLLESRNHIGLSACKGGRWSRRTSLFTRLLGTEPGIGAPQRDMQAALEAVTNDLDAAELSEVPVSAAVLFTSPNATLELEDCPVTTLTVRQIEGWAGSHQPQSAISEALRHKVVEHFASKIEDVAVPGAQAA